MGEALSHHPNAMERNYIGWRHHVERVFQMNAGAGTDTFPDYDFRGAFVAGKNPKEVVNAILDAAGWSR